MSQRASSSELAKFGIQPADKTVLGQIKWFDDKTPNSSGGIIATQHSNWAVEAILVVNNSGGLLLPGRRVIWDTSSTYGVGLGVGTYAGDDVAGAGIVSHLVASTGVTNGSTFWLIRKGPCKVRADGNAFTHGNEIRAGASGQAKSAAGTKIGIAAETFADTDADDFVRAFVEFTI